MTSEKDKKYEENEAKAIAELKPLLTNEFLDTLSKVAITYGWSGDFIEVATFSEWCFAVADKEVPILKPIDFSE